ncbi:MAG: ABC transporter ATP-binding protein [Oscillospiraceae bacterium]|nr:ABC transporter ATP-binding protein [Oscillospiraceae bacterium]
MLNIQNVTKTYGDLKAVNDLSLNVEAGDIFGFIGHNGAGKTTLIKAIVGIHTFDEGDILIDGDSIRTNAIACKRKMAYIPDNPDLYEFMKGDKYLDFVADMYDMPLAERKAAIEKYAKAFEIDDVLGSSVGSYSHGMKQKLALIAALMHSPKLLVLDEPFVGLDPKASHTLKGFMEEITGGGGAIFFSTHGLEVAQKLCNKIAIIKNGVLLESGPTAQIVGLKSLEDVFLELTDDET